MPTPTKTMTHPGATTSPQTPLSSGVEHPVRLHASRTPLKQPRRRPRLAGDCRGDCADSRRNPSSGLSLERRGTRDYAKGPVSLGANYSRRLKQITVTAMPDNARKKALEKLTSTPLYHRGDF